MTITTCTKTTPVARTNHVVGPCTGLKSRPRPARKYDLRPRPGPGPQQLCRPSPDTARKLNYKARARPGPQQVCPGPARPANQFHIWGPGPARARGPRAGPLARPHRPTKLELYYCVHILMWLISCYVYNHMFVWSLVSTSTSSYITMPNIASPVIEMSYIERYIFRWINF